MLQNDNRHRLLQVFYIDPVPQGIGFQLRELSRTAGIAPPSVKRYLKEFEKEGLIFEKKHRIYGYPVYYANRDSEDFKLQKTIDTIMRIQESGLLAYLKDRCAPDCIVLYGSASRGEDLLESDIDLFISSSEEKLNLAAFEKRLHRSIHILFAERFGSISSELKNNILNGKILAGYLKVF
jgi:predicted nucleotidyltransferase